MSGGTGRVLEGAAAVLPAALGGLFMLGRRRLPALRLGAVWAERPFWPSLFWRG
ncbi:MAG: hypothetical protein ACLRWQ_16605 [Flavonifractor plautii]